MQELLGKIAALDPEASLGIRVIACFDELIIGAVNTRALLSTAASLAGCPAGFAQDHPSRSMRVSPTGEELAPGSPAHAACHELPRGARVWLEREGAPHVNDAIIVERLALAVGVRLGIERHEIEPPRDIGILLDETVPAEVRGDAARRQGLSAATRYRVVAAPLFAVWAEHPQGPGDVVSTPLGPIHAVISPAAVDRVDVRPSGIGIAVCCDDLPRSFRTAVVALRLCAAPEEPFVSADSYGGLIELLADSPTRRSTPDSDRMDLVMGHCWARTTVQAVLNTTTIRQAARHDGVHHSTMQARIDTLTQELGFDPLHGYGRTRLGLAYLVWRLHTSRVLDLPTPAGQAPSRLSSAE